MNATNIASLAAALDLAISVEDVLAVIAGLKAEVKVTKEAAKVAPLPNVGDNVYFKAKNGTIQNGIVVGVQAAGGKGNPAMVKVLVGKGFEAATVTIFPSQIVGNPDEAPKEDAPQAE